MNYIKRHAESTIKNLSEQFPAVLVTGTRQCGKTTILKELTGGMNIEYLTFDSPLEEQNAKADPASFMLMHPSPIIFDEIQYVPDLFRYLKIDIDKNRKTQMYFLTGSGQVELLQKSSESLAGRIGIVNLMPLSKREINADVFTDSFLPNDEYILKRQKSLKEQGIKRDNIFSSIIKGGYPEVINKTTNADNFYSNYLRTYLEKDIRMTGNITDEMQFLQFLTIAASRIGQIINYKDISKDIGISEITIKKWLSILKTTGIIYLLYPYSSNIEKRVIKTPKLYFTDTGLAAYLTKWRDEKILETGAMSGPFFENYVISEIIKSYSNNGLEPSLYFYRDKDGVEIDLLIIENGTLYPVEIKKTATPTSFDARNFSATSHIKGLAIAKNTIICSVVSISLINQSTRALPVEFI